MNYSLGNMLSRGGALNPNGLSLDLAFAADKTLTARRGPTPTFTRASTATFVGSDGLIQSAAINDARFDHDPVTLACKGLLIEESRTNLLTRSNNFADASWTRNNSTLGSTTIQSPDGSNNATLLVAGTGLFSWIFKSVTNASGNTLSFFAKSSGKRWANVDASSGSAAAGVWFDLQNGAIGTVQTGYTASITAFPNGFYRCSVTYPSSGAGIFSVIGVSDNNSSFASTASGSNGIIIYGAQLEAGSFPTSYIPTTTAALTRSADVCSITGGDFTSLYNATEGTILANASTPASGDRTVLSIDDNTANEMTRLRTEGTNPFFKVTDGGSDVVAIDAGTVTANTTFKLAAAYEINNFAASINGGTVVADTSGTIPTVDRMRIGAGQGGNTMCGHIARIQYFRKRLPDAKLQSLTT